MKEVHMKKINFSIFTIALIASLFYCLIGSIAYAQTKALTGKETSARIDIYSDSKKFDLTGVKSNGKAWRPSAGEQKNRWWITELDLTGKDAWQELWIEFTPAESGFAYVELRGSFYPDLKTHHHEVWFDDMKVEGEGAAIENGGFEMADSKGNPVGWGVSEPSQNNYSRDGTEARTGKSCILVWHDRPVVQRFAVKAGNKYKISAWSKASQ
jgi:hypothetical protein